jgi:LysR family transcriptional regulator, hydrogen peroxide-inducible genes activator
MEMPTLRQLEYLVAVAEHGTFGAAAEAVHVSQPAMSSQIAELEQKLGVTLFERDRRGARVTPEGDAIVTAARRVLDEAAHLVQLASDRRGDIVGHLALGVIPTMAPYLLPTVVREIRRRYPATELRLRELRTVELVDAVLDGTLDLGLLAAPVPELGRGLEVVELARDPFVLALPEGHPFAGDARLPQSALSGLPMLLLEDGHCLRTHAESACSQIGASPLGSIQATGLPSLTQMVAAGMGATLLPACAVDVETRPGSGVTTRRLRSPEPFRTVVLAWRGNSPRAEHFRTLAGALAAPVVRACSLD